MIQAIIPSVILSALITFLGGAAYVSNAGYVKLGNATYDFRCQVLPGTQVEGEKQKATTLWAAVNASEVCIIRKTPGQVDE